VPPPRSCRYRHCRNSYATLAAWTRWHLAVLLGRHHPAHPWQPALYVAGSQHSLVAPYLATMVKPPSALPSQPKASVRLGPPQAPAWRDPLTASPVLMQRAPFPTQTTPKTANSPHAMAQCGLSRTVIVAAWVATHKTQLRRCAGDFRAGGASLYTPERRCMLVPQDWRVTITSLESWGVAFPPTVPTRRQKPGGGRRGAAARLVAGRAMRRGEPPSWAWRLERCRRSGAGAAGAGKGRRSGRRWWCCR
jgi:hypothetical protein